MFHQKLFNNRIFFLHFKKNNQISVKKAWTINLCLQVFKCYSPKDRFFLKKTNHKTKKTPTNPHETQPTSQEPLDHSISQFFILLGAGTQSRYFRPYHVFRE